MEHATPPQLSLEDLWHEVVNKCRETIDNPDDLNTIDKFHDHEEVIAALKDTVERQKSKPAMALRLRSVWFNLDSLRMFVTALFVGLGATNLSVACIFGGVYLLLEIVSQSDATLAEIADILDELGDNLKLFEIYRSSLDLDEETLSALFDILVELTLAIASAIKHFRSYRIQDALSPHTNWSHLVSRFSGNLRKLRSRIEQLRKLAEAKSSVRSHAELIQKLERMQVTSHETASGLRFRRCQTIPHPRNPAFFGRDDILQAISAAFEGQTSRPASVAIWGTGGIGKTHIALEFAHRLWSSGEETILWISSEKTAEVSKSFNDAAKGLELEGYSATNTPDQNRHLVLQWLQHTDAPWLLVFDNVESSKDVIQNWPTVGNGKILVTCRSIFVAEADTIATAIEVPAFTVPQTAEMIHKILNKRSAPGSCGQLEEDATNQLSSRLGGLPLAIDIVAKQIKLSRRFKSVAEYLPYYEENQESALKRQKRGGEDLWYSRDLHNLWQPAFDNLSEDATELMDMLCFMGPEAIPSFLFQGKDWSKLRLRWELLEDEERVDEATDVLLESALIGINNETGIIAVHRLIQDSYFLQMTATSRLKAFHSALTLLRTHFPSQVSNGAHHFYTKWDLCGRLHQHIVAFRDRCQSATSRGTLPTNEPAFIDLIRDDAWYMVETQQFLQAETALLSILGDIDKGSLLAATIQRSLLGLYERTGRSVKACTAAEIEFEILEKHGVSEGNDPANANSNVGYARASALRAAEGLKYLDVAVAMAKSHPEPECYREYNIDRFLRNRGRCKMQLKQFDEALKDFDEAEYFQDKMHGPDSHYHGETKHERSKIAAWRGDLASAAQLSREAHALVSAGKPTHASAMAAFYRQGWIAMLQRGDDNDDEALRLLEKALVLCQLNEPHRGNAGESARVWWRMSQVYERKGMVGEARRLREMAESVKRELLGTGDYAVVGGDEEAGWDALVGLLYR